MERLRYALGEHDFRKMRERNAVYIDKTQYIVRLLEGWDFYFLSRPRRFGKTLFINTLHEFFEGRRNLFKGLHIDSYPWDWDEYPVIRINLAEGDYHKESGLVQRLNEIISESEVKFGVKAEGTSPREKLRSLILNLYAGTGKRVVVLIDEYEKPLLDSLDENHHYAYKDELNAFYSTLKNNEEKIRFLFITGVTRFGHLNIFSGFNNLRDISLDPSFTAICGITEAEITDYLLPGVEFFAKNNSSSVESALLILKEYYDGYHFSSDLTDIYNPYSLLTALATGMLNDIWVESGNSRYLLDKLKESDFNLFDLDGLETTASTLKGLDPAYTDPVTLLYQSGYLTIKGYNNGIYTLALPNHEVKTSLLQAVIPFYLGQKARLSTADLLKIGNWATQGRAEDLMIWLQRFFSKVTYDMKLLPKEDLLRQESDFQFMIYAILSLAGGFDNLELEYATSWGRIDMVMKAMNYIYIFEFKLGESAVEALNQINSKDYALSWRADGRTVIKIGVAFSPQRRCISDFQIQK